MINTRLSLALAGGSALPGDGEILVLNALATSDLSVLPKGRTTIVQGFKPDHDALVARGFSVQPALAVGQGHFAAAIVFMPKARAEARALVAVAVDVVYPGGTIWVDGQKTDGIDTMVKDVRKIAQISQPMAKAHGKVFCFAAPLPGAFDNWRAVETVPAEGFLTLPGVFSADKIDRGSALLAAHLPPVLPPKIADLGAGWGWLSAQVLARDSVRELHLIEANYQALGCARRNVQDPRAQFHWADVTTFRPPVPFDMVVTNPPFHVGRAATPELGAEFIRSAAVMLTANGVLMLVANRHLPYEQVLSLAFRDVAEVAIHDGFKVFRAARPQLLAKASPPPRAGR